MSEIAITSLETSIPWNIRASADNTHNINEGIIHYSSMTIQTLRTNITEILQLPAPSGYGKFCYTLIALMNIRIPRDSKVFKEIPNICRCPYKLSSILNYIYDIYQNVLVNNNLPTIQGFEGPNIDREVILALQTMGPAGYLPTETVRLYNYATVFYLYWGYLNGSSLTNIKTQIDRISAVNVRSLRGAIPTEPVVEPIIQQREVQSRDNLKHLKEGYLKNYGLLCKHEIIKPEECVICLESMLLDTKKMDLIKVTDCGHMFHKSCLSKWKKNVCPTCRHPISNKTSSNTLRRVATQVRDNAIEIRPPGTSVRAPPILNEERMLNGERTRRSTRNTEERVVIPETIRRQRLRSPSSVWQGGDD